MEQRKSDVELGRFLSLVLRHNPDAAGITLDAHGWAQVEELLRGVARMGRRIDREILERIVRENNKQRYSFNEDHTRIRANQGHSVAVDVELEAQTPPGRLYHGTSREGLEQIRQSGEIRRQNRLHVHLSPDVPTARRVGGRHGVPVVLQVDAAAMVADGISFYRSVNGVWLCAGVPWRYLSVWQGEGE